MMVLYYGLLALETANNSVGTVTTTAKREVSSKKSPMSSSSSNSWIYTEDLRKRFEERYADYRYIFVPIYIDKKTAFQNRSTIGIIPEEFDEINSWKFNRTTKISSPGKRQGNLLRKNHFHQGSLSQSNKSLGNRTKIHQKDSVEDDDQETTENENHSRPLIKQKSSNFASYITSEPSNNHPTLINQPTNSKSAIIHNNNKLTRLRSFFFKSSSSSLAGTQ